MTEELKPKDAAEAVAIFRAQVIGPIAARDLKRGALADAIRALSKIAVRPPGATAKRLGIFRHSDVRHGPTLRVELRSVAVRVHALLDDASRRVMALDVVSAEREVDMIALMVTALRLHRQRQRCTSTTAPRIGARCSRRPVAGSTSVCSTRYPTTHRHAARWSASSARSARDASTTPAEIYELGRADGAPVADDRLRDALTVRVRWYARSKAGTSIRCASEWNRPSGSFFALSTTFSRPRDMVADIDASAVVPC